MNKAQIRYHTIFLLLVWGCSYTPSIISKGAITFDRNGGRFGDDLFSLAQCLWIAYKHGLDFFFTPFNYSDLLVAHHAYPHVNQNVIARYATTYVIGRGKSVPEVIDENGFYYSTYYCNSGINWSDREFRASLKRLITPYRKWSYMSLPDDALSVAIHVRRGGGYRIDTDFCRRRRPYHFPSTDYYGNSLQVLLDRYPQQRFFVHIFTDDRDPAAITDLIKKCIDRADLSRIEFSWRGKGNNHASNVVEDFFDMTTFDCLIRPNSNMSMFAERIGEHDVVVLPRQASPGRPWGRVTGIELRMKTEEGTTRDYVTISPFSRKEDSQKTTDDNQQNPVPHTQSRPFRPRKKRSIRLAVARKLLRRRLQLRQA